MNSVLADLYQQIILDHNAAPKNYGALAHATHSAAISNPLCGDRLTVYLEVQGEQIIAAQFEGQGCALSRAAASLVVSRLPGDTCTQALELARRVESLVREQPDTADAAALGDLVALGGVREFPARRRCVLLIAEALRRACP